MSSHNRALCFIVSQIFLCCSVVAQEQASSAGCFIYVDERLLVLEHISGKIDLPGGKLDEGESPQQAAERETKEEIGISAKAQELLYQFDDGFFLYHCSLEEKLAEKLEVPDSGKDEVAEVFFKKCKKLKKKNWRFKERFHQVKKACGKSGQPEELAQSGGSN